MLMCCKNESSVINLINSGQQLFSYNSHNFVAIFIPQGWTRTLHHGPLTEGDGSVQLTS